MRKTKPRVRWEVEWQELTSSAQQRQQEEAQGGPEYEHDIDADEHDVAKVFTTREDARVYARKVVNAGVTVYGHATIQKQEYQSVEGTLLSEWEPVGEIEYCEGDE